jgi:uncharacterized membrane protein
MPNPKARSRAAKIARLLPAVIFLKPFSNLFIAWGTRQMPELLSAHPLLLVSAILNPLVIAGTAIQILWFLMRMRLLSIADLTYVLPVTAIGYVITTLLGWLILHEDVSAVRWMGTILITLGTAFVASSPHTMTSSSPGEFDAGTPE